MVVITSCIDHFEASFGTVESYPEHNLLRHQHQPSRGFSAPTKWNANLQLSTFVLDHVADSPPSPLLAAHSDCIRS